MMNVQLNLMPPEKKTGLNRLVAFVFAKHMLESIIFTCALIAIVLLWSWLALIDEFRGLSGSALLVNREFSGYNQDVKNINRLIASLNRAAADYQPLLPKLKEITDALPANVRLTSLAINPGDKTIDIAGVGKDRAAVLNYQEKLRALSWLNNIELPTAQLFQKEDVNFVFKTTIK